MAAESVVYTLDGTITGGTNGYAEASSITQSDVDWSVMGNTTMSPWRIGGKSLTNENRPVFSKTAIANNITKIEIEHGAVNSVTVNSLTVIVASDANFANVISTLTPTFAANSKSTVTRPDGANWSNAYFKFVYNVTVSSTSNKYFEFKNAKFYAEESEAPAVANPVISGETSFFDQTEVTITCATEDAAIYYTLDGTDPTAESTAYTEAFTLTESKTVKAIAIKGSDASAIASKIFTKGQSFASFEALVAADVASNTRVKVSFSKVAITGIYTSSQQKRQGVYLNVKAANDKNIEIYYNAVEVPAEWEADAVLSGSIIGNWTFYSNGDQWEIVPESGWNWTSLTYEVLPQLNIMAYGLSASEVADGKVTISYSLNAKATAVEIQLIEADTVKERFAAPATGLSKGEHSVQIDLAEVEAGSYKWAVKATAAARNDAAPVKIGTYGTGHAMGRSVALDKNPESPYYGNVYSVNGQAVGLFGWDAAMNPLFDGEAVATNGWGSGNSAPCRAAVGEDGLVYLCDWSDSNPNVRIFDPANPTANAIDVFGGTASGDDGLMVNEQDEVIHGSMSYAMPFGSGANTYLVTVDEDRKVNGKLMMYKYNIGTAATPYTAAPEVALAVGEVTGGAIANANVTFAPSKFGGWWVSQHRYADATANPCLAHISKDNVVNYKSNNTFTNETVGYNNQASFDINNAQNLIVTSTSNSVFNILVSEVTWTDSVPTVAVKYTIPTSFGNTCLKVGIDEAQNVYGIAAGKPLTIWALPKADNSCVTPAAKASLIVIEADPTAIDNTYALEVQKVIRNGQVLIIRDGKTYNMMGQIVE